MQGRKINMLGRRCGRLTVTGDAGSDKRSQAIWHYVCDCGNTGTTRGADLRNGSSLSCGCLTLDVNRERKTTHGLTGTPEHNIWLVMRDRCRNPKNHKYSDYGGRGISVCSRWDNFEFFLADMGRRPSPSLSIDRINNDGNYEPGNCRWATAKEQVANRRRAPAIAADAALTKGEGAPMETS